MKGAYYNENDPYAAQWLRNLIKEGLIADGDVDERSIIDVGADDIKGYIQCHFFAGIGGWSYALRLAGWPDDKPVWTGSCPCQPFSSAGQRKTIKDERHLWPQWFRLIEAVKPQIIFGEQVAASSVVSKPKRAPTRFGGFFNAAVRDPADEFGGAWLDLVFADLETVNYTCGAAVLPACGVGAPHIRNRLWFVGHAESGERRLPARPNGRENSQFAGPSEACELPDTSGDRRQDGWLGREQLETQPPGNERDAFERSRRSPWADCDWLPCTDGKARPVESGTFPLATGIPGRVGRLRAYGNAIVPQVAAEFISAFMDPK